MFIAQHRPAGWDPFRLACAAVIGCMSFSHAQDLTLEAALDVEDKGWVFTSTNDEDGNPAWTPTTARSHDGEDCVTVTTDGLDISHDLSTTIEGPAKLRFLAEYETDVDPKEAWFEFLVDGVSRFRVSGDTNFIYQEFYEGIGPGTHVVSWRYVKNFSFRARQYVYLDELECIPIGEGPPAFGTLPPEVIDRCAGEHLELTIEAIDATSYQWFKDDIELPGATGPTLILSDLSPADSGTYHLAASNASGNASSRPSDLRVWSGDDLPAVIGLPDFDPAAIDLGGDGPWKPTRGRSVRGDSSMRAPTLEHGEYADFCMTVEGPMRVQFDWSVSSELWSDILEFLVDDVPVTETSGNPVLGQFRTNTVAITPGTHKLTWRYRKDSAVSHYQDTAWIDNIRLTEGLGTEMPLIAVQPWSTTVSPGNTFDLRVGLPYGSPQPITVQWFKDGVAIPESNNTTLSFPRADPALHTGTYTAHISSANGSVESDPAVVTVEQGPFSGFVEIHRPPTTRNLNAVVILPDGKILAFGDGVMVESTDDGENWSASNPFHGRRINDAAVAPSGTVAVVGSNGFFAASYDGGSSWEWAPRLSPRSLRAITFIPPPPSGDKGAPGGDVFATFGDRSDGWIAVLKEGEKITLKKRDILGSEPIDIKAADADHGSLVISGHSLDVTKLLSYDTWPTEDEPLSGIEVWLNIPFTGGDTNSDLNVVVTPEGAAVSQANEVFFVDPKTGDLIDGPAHLEEGVSIAAMDESPFDGLDVAIDDCILLSGQADNGLAFGAKIGLNSGINDFAANSDLTVTVGTSGAIAVISPDGRVDESPPALPVIDTTFTGQDWVILQERLVQTAGGDVNLPEQFTLSNEARIFSTGEDGEAVVIDGLKLFHVDYSSVPPTATRLDLSESLPAGVDRVHVSPDTPPKVFALGDEQALTAEIDSWGTAPQFAEIDPGIWPDTLGPGAQFKEPPSGNTVIWKQDGTTATITDIGGQPILQQLSPPIEFRSLGDTLKSWDQAPDGTLFGVTNFGDFVCFRNGSWEFCGSQLSGVSASLTNHIIWHETLGEYVALTFNGDFFCIGGDLESVERLVTGESGFDLASVAISQEQVMFRTRVGNGVEITPLGPPGLSDLTGLSQNEAIARIDADVFKPGYQICEEWNPDVAAGVVIAWEQGGPTEMVKLIVSRGPVPSPTARLADHQTTLSPTEPTVLPNSDSERTILIPNQWGTEGAVTVTVNDAPPIEGVLGTISAAVPLENLPPGRHRVQVDVSLNVTGAATATSEFEVLIHGDFSISESLPDEENLVEISWQVETGEVSWLLQRRIPSTGAWETLEHARPPYVVPKESATKGLFRLSAQQAP